MIAGRYGWVAGWRIVALWCAVCVLACGCGSGEGRARTKELVADRFVAWQVPPAVEAAPAPRAACVAEGKAYVCDTAARVLVYGMDGTYERTWAMPEKAAGKPEGIVVMKDGRIAVADTHYSRVVFFSTEGTVVGMLGKQGKGPGEFIFPVAVAVDPSDNLYVAEYGGNDRVQKFDAAGKFLAAFGSFGTGPGGFQRPSGVAWHAGKVYVADAFNNRVQVFTDDGKFEGVLGGERAPQLQYPYGLSVRGERIYVIEYGACRLTVLDLGGAVVGRYGRPGAGDGCFGTPWGLASDPSGNVLLAMDTGNRRVVRIDHRWNEAGGH